MKDDLQYVTFQTARPARDPEVFPGRIEEGMFAVEGDFVILYSADGLERLDKQEIIPNLSAKQTASLMLKRRAGIRNTDFGRKLNYPRNYY